MQRIANTPVHMGDKRALHHGVSLGHNQTEFAPSSQTLTFQCPMTESPLTHPTVRGACPHDCPDTCALLTTVENGRATKVQGNPAHAPTDGVLCTKVSRYAERTYHPERLLQPFPPGRRRSHARSAPCGR